MNISQIWSLGRWKLGMMKWSLNMIKSELPESFRLVLMTQVETGHFSWKVRVKGYLSHRCFYNTFRKTPRPGLTPQPEAPVQKRIFFSGTSGLSWSVGIVPTGGRNINWEIIRSPGASSGNKVASLSPVSELTGQWWGQTSPSFMYQGLPSLLSLVELVILETGTFSPRITLTSGSIDKVLISPCN